MRVSRSQFVHFEIGLNILPVTLDSLAQQGAAVVAVAAVVAAVVAGGGHPNLGEGPPPSPLLQGTHDCRVDVELEDADEEERVSAGGIYLNPRILQALQGCSDTNVATSRKANMIVVDSPHFCLRFVSAC